MEAIKLAGTFEAVQELHTTGQFENSAGELCTVTMELDTSDPVEHDYVVRSQRRVIAQVAGAVVVTTTDSVETYYSMKTAQRGYNWQLYVLQATAEQERAYKLGGYSEPVAVEVVTWG